MKTDLLIMAAGMGSRFGGLKQAAAVGENGEMIISNMDTLIPDLVYIIGTVTDYYFSVNGSEKVCMQDLYGTNKHIRIYCRGF